VRSWLYIWMPLILLPFASGARAADGMEAKAELCSGCHGEQGLPQETATPIIWGQTEGYLYIQLRDYKKGTRKNDIMSEVTASLERQDMFDLAAYFAAKPWPKTQWPPAPEASVKQAIAADNAVVCTGCHLEQYQGTGTAPRLADQSPEYLARSMTDFRTGARGNNPGMTSLMQAVTDSDIAALAAYLATL
jgi:cytochrome c553